MLSSDQVSESGPKVCQGRTADSLDITKYIKKSSQTHQKHITTHQTLNHTKLYIKKNVRTSKQHIKCFDVLLMCFDVHIKYFDVLLMCFDVHIKFPKFVK